MLRHDDPLPRRPRRVLVAGVSGAGKTTLARRVGSLVGAPHTEIDALFHGPGWVPRTEFLDDVRAFAAQDAWTTEWQYSEARPILAARADLLVWLDLPFTTVTLPRLLRRTVGRRVRREELWNGNVEPPLWTVLTDREHVVRWAVHTRGKLRVRVPQLEEHAPHLVVVRLRSPREVTRWVDGPLRAAVGSRAGDH
ncbi:AAA family ATPase [Oceanitalea stevensii]|uniref:AAA family ATPase n=1 Tax=Oceanitalea stevensii TaxID=2763072 RepID=A0ABR8Z0Y4_9MICO|nr:AAA family ATPase [Oceanitalea stevensii]MBD8061955.1 AAA family ATPase [Oceanitalea stevensii]